GFDAAAAADTAVEGPGGGEAGDDERESAGGGAAGVGARGGDELAVRLDGHGVGEAVLAAEVRDDQAAAAEGRVEGAGGRHAAVFERFEARAGVGCGTTHGQYSLEGRLAVQGSTPRARKPGARGDAVSGSVPWLCRGAGRAGERWSPADVTLAVDAREQVVHRTAVGPVGRGQGQPPARRLGV